MARRKKGNRKKPRNKRKRNLDIVRLSPVRLQTLPDELDVTLFFTHEFKSATTGVGVGGVMATFNVNGNNISNPMTNVSGPTFIKYDAAVGGSGAGFGGTQSADFAAQVTPGFFVYLLQAYLNYYCAKSTINVDVWLQDSNGEGDLWIQPFGLGQSNTTSAQNISQSKYVKHRRCGYNSYGMGNSNSLSNSITTKKVFGYNTSDQILKTDPTLCGTQASPLVSQSYLWQVGYANRSNLVSTGAMTFQTRIKYDVKFMNLQKHLQ